MFFQVSKIIGLPIGELDTQAKIADVRQILVDPQTGKLIGLLVKQSGFFGKIKILSTGDILDFDRLAIVTKSSENLIDPTEIIKAKEVIQKKIYIIGMRARTESGQTLGQIYDFVFDDVNLKITKFYIRSFLEEKILPFKKVVKVDENRHEIVFLDSVLKVKKVKQIKKVLARKAMT